jgi:hypothetical protein
VFKVQRFKVPVDGLGAREGGFGGQGSKVQGSDGGSLCMGRRFLHFDFPSSGSGQAAQCDSTSTSLLQAQGRLLSVTRVPGEGGLCGGKGLPRWRG